MKKFLFLFVFLLLAGIPAIFADGDENCSGTTTWTVPFCNNGSTVGAVSEADCNGTSGGRAGRDEVYHIVGLTIGNLYHFVAEADYDADFNLATACNTGTSGVVICTDYTGTHEDPSCSGTLVHNSWGYITYNWTATTAECWFWVDSYSSSAAGGNYSVEVTDITPPPPTPAPLGCSTFETTLDGWNACSGSTWVRSTTVQSCAMPCEGAGYAYTSYQSGGLWRLLYKKFDISSCVLGNNDIMLDFCWLLMQDDTYAAGYTHMRAMAACGDLTPLQACDIANYPYQLWDGQNTTTAPICGNASLSLRTLISECPPCAAEGVITIAFAYEANNNYGVGVDNVCIYCGPECPTGPEYDWGDAPDPTYPTYSLSTGANHLIVPGFSMGSNVDSELDGQPDATATGDDIASADDEDGVVFTSFLYPGFSASVTVTASVPCLLNAWIDFNGNGSWADLGDQIFTNTSLIAGANALTFTVDPSAVPFSTTFSRFRINTAGSLSYTGAALDGEVEDYQVSISGVLTLPWGCDFQTDDCGAIYEPDAGGQSWIRSSSYGCPQPSMAHGYASYTDLDYFVYGPFALPAGATGMTLAYDLGISSWNDQITVFTICDTYVDPNVNIAAWTSVEGPMSDEQSCTAHSVDLTPLLTSCTSLFWVAWEYSGYDLLYAYVDNINLTYIEPGLDFGDAPDPTYPTLNASGGPSHLQPSALYLGTSTPDVEVDGQPDPTATGDDLAGVDDEDGVVFTSFLTPGTVATVDVTASAPGLLNGWIDFNINGNWADPGEQVFVDAPVIAGVNALTIAVPPYAPPMGVSFARFRISTMPGLSFVGPAGDGEVEDYQVMFVIPAANDLCENVTPVTLVSGVAQQFTGDNTYCGNECAMFPGYNDVWLAFTLTEPSNVVMDYCDTVATWGNMWLNLVESCPCDNVTRAATYEFTTCANTQITMTWACLDAGTYYYPVMQDPANSAIGPYTINVTATAIVSQAVLPWTGTSAYYNVAGNDLSGVVSYNFVDLTGLGTDLLLTDDGGVVITPGLTMDFFGTAYTTLYVSSNGYVRPGQSSSAGYGDTCPAPDASNDYLVELLHDDLWANPTYGGFVRWMLQGTTPNQELLIHWHTYYYGSYNNPLDFELKYKEIDQSWEFHYADVQSYDATQDHGALSIVGMEATNTQYVNYSCDTACALVGGRAFRFDYIPPDTPTPEATYTPEATNTPEPTNTPEATNTPEDTATPYSGPVPATGPVGIGIMIAALSMALGFGALRRKN